LTRITQNALDTVGDRDFALDFVYASARCLIHLSRISQDVIDFASAEFGFISLADRISFGSSMMPQKRNPDLFELIRGKASRGIGALTALMTTVKGLPVGYMRDLQEDKGSYLPAAELTRESLQALAAGLAGIRFVEAKMTSALEGGTTQATDLAERLVSRGVPFRDAYRVVGKLVQAVSESGKSLQQAGPKELSMAEGQVSSDDLLLLSARAAVEAKERPGATGPKAVAEQAEQLRESMAGARARAEATPRLVRLIQQLSL
jgi:argininosuccinate lyase